MTTIASRALLSSALPFDDTPSLDETLQARYQECERSREWWKHRAGVLDLRCREINAQLRDSITENKRSPLPLHHPGLPLNGCLICRLKEENERLAAELHNHRMRMIAEQTLRKIDSNANTPTPTPPRTPTPMTPTTPRSPATSRSPASRIPVSPRMNGWSQLW